MPSIDNENTPSSQVQRDNLESKSEFLDAVRRHICQILAFDYGFIDMASGHEIANLATFSADDEDDVANEFVESLVDEHKQPISVANTLGAQKVKQTQRAWVGKAYTPEDLEGVTDASEIEADGFPYAIVPVMDNPMGGTGQVNGLIRVISFDPSRAITTQDLTTLKLMGEHLASRTGLFGVSSASPDDENEASGEHGDLDTVLIVHANRPVRRRFSRILIKMYKVLEAESSERALELLESNRVDVILLDGEMQGTSGFGFCKVLKESPKWKHIPVILLVSDDKPSARVEGLNVGADDCVPDSCFDSELAARVKSSLRHRKVEREQAVQLQLLEDYAQRLEKAHEQLSIDRQTQIQKNSQLEQLRRESDMMRHQDNLLHRISNIIRRSFDIRENLEEMLEALAGWFSLDCCFIVMPSEDEPDDTIRVEFVASKEYKVVDYDRDLDTYKIFETKFDSNQALICNDAANDRRLDPFHKILKSGFKVQSLFYIPISYEQKLQGLLVGYKCETKANWSRINETFMKSVSDQVAAGVVNARLYARVQRQATTDGLTMLFNHRTGQEKLAEQLKLAERYQRHLSVIMLDVDHFKSINDTYGHPAGDSVLKAMSRLIKSSCRDVDIPVRYGGEEFLLVLPEVTQDGAVVVAERIRKALQEETISHEDLRINVTGSFGVSAFPDDADGQQALLDLADKSLYLSKRLGRNRVSTAADLLFHEAEMEAKSAEDIAKDMAEQSTFTPPVISKEAREQEELVPEVVDMVKSLAASLYARSSYNKQHHLEVARLSELLAKVMGLSAQQVEQIRVAGLLHDVGILNLPEEILEKEGPISKQEREILNQHPLLGAQMLRPVRALKDICEILENHHERWDGTGYPRGIKGEDIPLPARIVAIVDSYHALVSDRPYRKAFSHDDALKTLRQGAGSQWDPFLVEIFSAVMKSMKDTVAKGSETADGAAKSASETRSKGNVESTDEETKQGKGTETVAEKQVASGESEDSDDEDPGLDNKDVEPAAPSASQKNETNEPDEKGSEDDEVEVKSSDEEVGEEEEEEEEEEEDVTEEESSEEVIPESAGDSEDEGADEGNGEVRLEDAKEPATLPATAQPLAGSAPSPKPSVSDTPKPVFPQEAAAGSKLDVRLFPRAPMDLEDSGSHSTGSPKDEEPAAPPPVIKPVGSRFEQITSAPPRQEEQPPQEAPTQATAPQEHGTPPAVAGDSAPSVVAGEPAPSTVPDNAPQTEQPRHVTPQEPPTGFDMFDTSGQADRKSPPLTLDDWHKQVESGQDEHPALAAQKPHGQQPSGYQQFSQSQVTSTPQPAPAPAGQQQGAQTLPQQLGQPQQGMTGQAQPQPGQPPQGTPGQPQPSMPGVSQPPPGQPPQGMPGQPQPQQGQPPQGMPGQPQPQLGQPPQGMPGQPQPQLGQPPQGMPGQPQPQLGQPPQGMPGQPQPQLGQPPQGMPGQPQPQLGQPPQGMPGQPQPQLGQPPQGMPGQPQPQPGQGGQPHASPAQLGSPSVQPLQSLPPQVQHLQPGPPPGAQPPQGAPQSGMQQPSAQGLPHQTSGTGQPVGVSSPPPANPFLVPPQQAQAQLQQQALQQQALQQAARPQQIAPQGPPAIPGQAPAANPFLQAQAGVGQVGSEKPVYDFDEEDDIEGDL